MTGEIISMDQANTYAINVTRRKEFEVEQELITLGLHPWVPRRLMNLYVKEKRESVWYDAPYVHKLIFCVIPAIYWRDVVDIKHVIGKPGPLSRLDIEGMPAHRKRMAGEDRGEGTGALTPGRPGLRQFKEAVHAEYEDAERLKANSSYQCQYRPGQALEILDKVFEGHQGVFKEAVKRAHDDFPKLVVEMEVMGRRADVEFSPDKVRELK